MAATSVLFLLALVAFAAADIDVIRKLRNTETLSDFERAELAQVDENELPEPIQRVTRVAKRSANFCCKNLPVQIITKTKSAARIEVVKSRFKTGHANCGTFGLGRCTTWGTRYRQVTKYVTEYYQVDTQGKCRTEDITCCSYYIKVAGKCVHLDDLSSVVDGLIG